MKAARNKLWIGVAIWWVSTLPQCPFEWPGSRSGLELADHKGTLGWSVRHFLSETHFKALHEQALMAASDFQCFSPLPNITTWTMFRCILHIGWAMVLTKQVRGWSLNDVTFWHALIQAFYLFPVLLSIVSNITVVVVLWFRRKRMKATHWFIIALAISDISCSVIMHPILIATTLGADVKTVFTKQG